MTRLEAHQQALYELRFSPMCKPAAEVANLTQLESHTTRARTLMFWRIGQGYLNWGPREVELLYQSTLDSISEAFDVYHYPVSQYMLDARADVWEAGLAPECVKQAVEASNTVPAVPANVPNGTALVLAGEIAQLGDDSLLAPLSRALQAAGIEATTWMASTGALAYALGAWDVAKMQATRIVEGIADCGAKIIIADGPETAWALAKIYPALGINLPEGVTIRLPAAVLEKNLAPPPKDLGTVFVHDSRPAYFLADQTASHLAILPGYVENEADFGTGVVYEALRNLIDTIGGQRVYGAWTRALAKSSGADDGLWLTYPDLAAGLAVQRLDYAKQLGATTIVTDSPLAANLLGRAAENSEIQGYWLPDLVTIKAGVA